MKKLFALSIPLLCIVVVFAGCSLIGEEVDILDCESCSNQLQEDYLLYHDGRYKCYECVFEEYSAVSSKEIGKCINCNAFYYHAHSYGAGLCGDCGDRSVTLCNYCGDATLDWGDGIGFAICPDCMGDALEHKGVAREIQKFIDGE